MRLSVRKLSFSYARVPVLADISFDAAPGECVAILGTNGAGKTTLLKCIDCILTPTAGEILIDGRNIRALSPAARAKTVAYIPQQLTLADATVFDAVLLGRLPHLRREATAHDLSVVGEVLERLELTPFAARNVLSLSGGERQKVVVARALAQEAKLLLFDEPTSHLDMQNALAVARLLRQLADSDGHTVLVAMHDLNLALRFADRFVLMKDETVFAAGDKSCITPASIRAVYGVEATVAEVAGETVVVASG